MLLKTASDSRMLVCLYSMIAISNDGALVACGASNRKSVSAWSSPAGAAASLVAVMLAVVSVAVTVTFEVTVVLVRPACPTFLPLVFR